MFDFCHEFQEESEFGDFNRTGINVHSVKAVLNGVAFEVVGGAFVKVVEVGSQRATRADKLRHHPNGIRARTDGRITDRDRSEFLVNEPSVNLDACWPPVSFVFPDPAPSGFPRMAASSTWPRLRERSSPWTRPTGRRRSWRL